MFKKIISEIEMERISKTIMTSLAETYQSNLPDTLFENHYELAMNYGFTAQNWNEFLKIREINQIVESEIASIAEIGARRAIDNLQSGEAKSADIQAARELLANSRLIKQRNNQKPHVFVTRIPEKEYANVENTSEISG